MVRTIRTVKIQGALAADTEERLIHFLDIRPGDAWEDQLQSRVIQDLKVLGYQADDRFVDGHLTLLLKALRTVRRIFVSGNWPLFENQVQSNLTFRPRDRLPEGERLADQIRKQEENLTDYLRRNGYYDATAQISLEWDEGSPEQVDVRVQVHLNTGFWRLRYPIGTVQARGFHLLPPEKVRSFFEHCCLWFGRTDTDQINRDFKRLIDYYQEHGYAGARLTQRDFRPDRKKKQMDVAVTIDERKQIELRFVGHKDLTVKELRAAVTIFRDNYYSANELDESARQLFRLYQQKGFFEAQVGWRWKSRDTDPLVVDFVIYEGPELRVQDVTFVSGTGKKLFFTDDDLHKVITTKRYPRLGLIGLGEGGYATAVQLEQDVQRLTRYYRDAGFPGVVVYPEVARSQEALDSAGLLGLATAVSRDSNANLNWGELYVRFRIEEGAREQLTEVVVDCNKQRPDEISAQEVRAVLRFKPGMPYTLGSREDDKDRIARLFRSRGHPYLKMDINTTWDPTHEKATLHWQIVGQGPLVRFGPILIRGNVVTRESVIRKDLPFKEGDVYNAELIREAQQNLFRRQLYSFARVSPNPGESAQYVGEAQEAGWVLERVRVPVLVEVGERYDNRGEISAYAGVSSDNIVYGTAGYTWSNLAGTGIELEVKGELGVRIQSLLARLADPQFFDQNWRLDVRGFWRNEKTYSLGPVTTYGANAEVTRFVTNIDQEGRRLPPTLKFFTKLEFAISQLLDPLYRSEGTSDFGAIGDQTQELRLSVGLVWDRRVGFDAPALRRDGLPVPIDPLMPVSGFMISSQATAALCCSFTSVDLTGSYITFRLQVMGLKPVGPELSALQGWPYGMKRFNLKGSMQLDYGLPLFHPALPVVERFYAGGDTSTRGYDTDALKAEEVRSPIGPIPGEPAYRVVPQGGNIRFLSQLEWEFAITPKLLGWPWVGALFIDTGAVFNSFSAVTWNDVRFSVGFSLLRLLTRFGALSLEYAYPVTLPGQEPLLQSDRWKSDPWYTHWPGRIHFNWGIPISR